jgi:diaminohydroxyphosphoribosylaminopyrimidine deaminase/5-amino-6-(5-phosphoribosylamino)uracil reductase
MMRAMNDAVMIGIGTALADDPQLTCRLPGMAARSPVRVVLDAGLRLPPAGALAASARIVPVWVIAASTGGEDAERQLRALGVEVLRCEARDGLVDLHAALRSLAGRGITRLMVEGGATVAAALVAADLVDEATILRGPQRLGPDGIDALTDTPLSTLTDSPRLRLRKREALGGDIIETFERR